MFKILASQLQVETENSLVGTVYQPDDIRGAVPASRAASWSAETPIIVQLPEEQKGAAPPEAEIAIGHDTLSAESTRNGICRIDVEIEYAPRCEENINEVREPFGTAERENLVYSLFVSIDLARNVHEVEGPPIEDQIAIGSTDIAQCPYKIAFIEERSKSCGNNATISDLLRLDANRPIEILARSRLAAESENDAPDSVRAVVRGGVNTMTDSSGNWHHR